MKTLIRTLLAAVVVITSCGGSDFEDSALGLTEWDHGWLIVVEPDEPFGIGLATSTVSPDTAWRIVEFDSTVIALEGEERIPADADVEEGGSGLARTAFDFAGVAPGETPLRFELVVDGRPIDIAEFTVAVVEDPCAGDVGARANRCGDSFTYHPQNLSELDHGTTVSLEPGSSLDMVLTANARFPANQWKVVEADAAVIEVTGPVAGPADREPGDWSPWEPDARHSFLPTSRFTMVGVSEGRTTLVLELADDDGRPVDRIALTLDVGAG